MTGKAINAFPESLIQWIWGNLQFNCNQLQTASGQAIEIVSPGELNHAAGPDFKNAEFIIEGVRWFGSVEIHNNAKDWNYHGHHHDPAYGGVVLHVVLTNPHFHAHTIHGSVPYTLHLFPYLHKSLAALLEKREVQGLPCGANITYINQEAFERQIEAAHKEYFDYKLQELLGCYQPQLVPSRAWKECFIQQIYKTLGISSNISQMDELYQSLSDEVHLYTSESDWVEHVNHSAFTKSGRSIPWQTGGMRPVSRPKNRVCQAAAFQYAIIQSPISEILKYGIDFWPLLNGNVTDLFRTRGERHELLRTTVFLPAIYLLGQLFNDQHLMKSSFDTWLSSARVVPQEVSSPFIKAGFDVAGPARKSGLAHQLKRYCSGHRCHRCEVFKSAIRP